MLRALHHRQLANKPQQLAAELMVRREDRQTVRMLVENTTASSGFRPTTVSAGFLPPPLPITRPASLLALGAHLRKSG